MLHSMLVVRKCSGSLHVPYYWQHRALLALRATALHSESERHVRSLRPKATSWFNTTNINENCQILCPSTNTLCVWHCVTKETSPSTQSKLSNSQQWQHGNCVPAQASTLAHGNLWLLLLLAELHSPLPQLREEGHLKVHIRG